MPFFSIIIPVYNGEEYISETLDSLINQSMPDFEAIIVDDGSTDASASICEQYAKKDPRFKLIKSVRGGKPSIARNIGIRESTGKFICFLDSDDLWLESTLALRQQLLEKHPEIGFLCSDYKDFRVTNGHKNIDTISYLEKNATFYQQLIDDHSIQSAKNYAIFSSSVKEKLMSKVFIHTSTVTLKNTSGDQALRFDEDLTYGEDWKLWINSLQHSPLAILTSALCLKRQRGDSLTAAVEQYLTAEISFQKQFLSDPTVSPVSKTVIRHALAKKCLRLANSHYYASKAGLALSYYQSAWRYNPKAFTEYKKVLMCLLSSPVLRTARSLKG